MAAARLRNAVISRLLRTAPLILRALFGRPARGGTLPATRAHPGDRMAMLHPGGPIDDPDEAEALGLTADAKRLRRGSGHS